MKLSPRVLAGPLSMLAILWQAEMCLAAPTLLVASRDTNSVLEFDAQSGAFLRVVVPSGAGGLDFPQSITLAPNGNLLVANGVGDNVLEFHPETGDLARILVANVNGATAFAYSPNGSLLVASGATDSVLEVSPVSGAMVGTLVPNGTGGLDGPVALSIGPDGHLYVSSLLTDSVIRYDSQTGTPLGTFTGESTLDGPSDLLFRANGNLLVASSNTGNVKSLTASRASLSATLQGLVGSSAPWA